MRVLRKGMTGSDVQRWQQALIDKGYLRGTADGSFGPLTEAATMAFQRDNGLVADGIAGPAAFARMGLADEPAPTPGLRITLSEGLLRRIMPGANAARVAEYAPFLHKAMEEFAIDTPARAAAFLAQLAHESGQLRWMQEIWGPTSAQRRYEPPSSLAKTLGNTQPGDGKRFMGRGPIQLTGRANYKIFGDALGVDLVGSPALAATKEVGFRIAGLYWQKRGLNPLADRGDFRRITKLINGGYNGLEDRTRFWERAKQVLGVRALVAAAARALRQRAVDEAPDPRFRRGLDAPGEITPTAAERSAGVRPRRAAAKRRAPKKAAATRSAARKQAAKKSTAGKTTASKARPARKKPTRTKAAKAKASRTRATAARSRKAKATKTRRVRATAARSRAKTTVRKKTTRRRGR